MSSSAVAVPTGTVKFARVVRGDVCFPETRDLDLQTSGLLGGYMPEGRALVNIWKAST